MDFIAQGFNFFGNAPFDVEAKQILIEVVLLMARIPGKEAPMMGTRVHDEETKPRSLQDAPCLDKWVLYDDGHRLCG